MHENPEEGKVAWNFTRKDAVRGGLATVGVALALVVPAAADDAPVVTRAPEIQGTLMVGQTLRAVNGAWSGSQDAAANYTWRRCPDQDFEDCITIPRATGETYQLTSDDAGFMMRVTLAVSLGEDSDSKTSDPTEPVKTTSGATPTPATPVFSLPPASGGGVLPAGAKLIRPRPVVRISGRYTASGANITRFTVLAPKGATIKIACTKGTCPVKHQTIKGGHTTHVKKFERALRSGTRITVTVSRSGYVSQITTITIRARKAPTRSDSCQLPGKKTTQKCPS